MKSKTKGNRRPSEGYIHYSSDGKHRFCTDRKKGKDALTKDWSKTTCPKCKTRKKKK